MRSVRSTLYEELSTNRRVRLHWKVGEAIAARRGSQADSIDQLAHHFGEGAMAGDPMIAVEHCVARCGTGGGRPRVRSGSSVVRASARALELVADPDLATQADIEIARAVTLRDAGDGAFRDAAFAGAATARRFGDPSVLRRQRSRWTR